MARVGQQFVPDVMDLILGRHCGVRQYGPGHAVHFVQKRRYENIETSQRNVMYYIIIYAEHHTSKIERSDTSSTTKGLSSIFLAKYMEVSWKKKYFLKASVQLH